MGRARSPLSAVCVEQPQSTVNGTIRPGSDPSLSKAVKEGSTYLFQQQNNIKMSPCDQKVYHNTQLRLMSGYLRWIACFRGNLGGLIMSRL
ncbi:hypothetical protein FGO68_gene10099 [Halteria grandinella]|uniref:Uncharacterized protein n=1 Tax=Halteria grandinella TaxID=5974 RepID=A0A8J8NA24_HALGN|nr:hypothetical protein FGO68_gene10099 [Halteria grandinella]